MADHAAFASADKQWLIGLQNGFTQPSALRRLLAMPKSQLCLVDIHAVLKSPSLAASTFFHPKVYEFASVQASETAIVATSANLTEGGLKNNVEQFMSWDGPLHEEVPKVWSAWWAKFWKPEWLATEALISAYEKRRPAMQHASGGLPAASAPLHEIEPSSTELRAAASMWIEAVRPLEGGSRNQLELMLNAHMFFYPDLVTAPRNAPRRLVFVDDAGNISTSLQRQILYNGPPLRTRGNAMWRIYLPTAVEGLSGYQDGKVLLRFTRTVDRDRYLLSFVPTNSTEATKWYDKSSKVSSVPGPPPRLMGWTS